MNLPPAMLLVDPTPEQLDLAKQAHMGYFKVFSGGKFLHWKLKHLKTPRPCGCG